MTVKDFDYCLDHEITIFATENETKKKNQLKRYTSNLIRLKEPKRRLDNFIDLLFLLLRIEFL